MVWGGLGCVLGYLQSGVKLRTQKGGHAQKKLKKWGLRSDVITISRFLDLGVVMTTLHVVREAQSRWARASTAERRAHPDNKRLEAFFRNNGIEDRSFDPSIKEVWQDRKGGKKTVF